MLHGYWRKSYEKDGLLVLHYYQDEYVKYLSNNPNPWKLFYFFLIYRVKQSYYLILNWKFWILTTTEMLYVHQLLSIDHYLSSFDFFVWNLSMRAEGPSTNIIRDLNEWRFKGEGKTSTRKQGLGTYRIFKHLNFTQLNKLHFTYLCGLRRVAWSDDLKQSKG